jgi:hypothetical protein
MSTSNTKVLQKVFLFLTTERSFQKRWVSLSSIESALRLRYPFTDHYNYEKVMLRKSLGKLHPKIDSLQTQMVLECTDARCREAFSLQSKI